MAPRSTAERAQLARRRLDTEADVWVATASSDCRPHLVPLSLGWIDDRAVAISEATTPTARNATATGLARLALESTSDVVLLDVDVTVVPLTDVDPALVEQFAARAGWDPRADAADWVLLSMIPRRGHAWNGIAEFEGRTIVRDGVWAS